ncbi:hypothetical protein Tco_0172673 [Tanacetum coccineum]
MGTTTLNSYFLVVAVIICYVQDLGFIPSGNVVLSSTYVGKILGADQLLVILCYRIGVSVETEKLFEMSFYIKLLLSPSRENVIWMVVLVSQARPEKSKVVRLGINPMIQPEPEDLPKDNPKLEIAVLRMKKKCMDKGSKRKGSLPPTLRQKPGQYICCQNHKLIADIENDIMDPVMQCTTLPSHSSFSQQKLVSFVTEIHKLSIDISLRDC